MGKLELHNPEFDIKVELNGETQTIQVSPAETSDGIEYFNCMLENKQITQIRFEENKYWEQLWGNLSHQEVQLIGEQIERKDK